MSYRVVTGVDDSELMSKANRLTNRVWPEFMLHDAVACELFGDLYIRFPEYQFGLINEANNRLFATANSIPLAYDGAVDDLPDEGWDWALKKGVEDHRAGKTPTILCAIQIAIAKSFQQYGLSSLMLELMKDLTDESRLKCLIAPVRPTMKSDYPLTPIDNYINWITEEGEPFDPWLRVHVRAGASIIKVCHQAMHISGSINDWSEWTELVFPESGDYVVPGALLPVKIDVEHDRGTYIEPNVWLGHPIR